MTIHTAHEVRMMFGKGPASMQVEIVIPAGTRCSETGDGQYFVEDLSFLDRNSTTWHDANYYGIRLTAEQVTVREG